MHKPIIDLEEVMEDPSYEDENGLTWVNLHGISGVGDHDAEIPYLVKAIEAYNNGRDSFISQYNPRCAGNRFDESRKIRIRGHGYGFGIITLDGKANKIKVLYDYCCRKVFDFTEY